MAVTDFDLTIDGIACRIKRGEGGYKERYVRTEITQNLLSQTEGSGQNSRPDQPAFYQSDWASGARWWKPIAAGEDLKSYFQANHMDLWSEPGKVVPSNVVVDAANTNLHDHCVIAVGAAGVVYAIGFTEVTNAGLLDTYVWTPASNAFVRDAGQNSGVGTGDNPLAMVYDPADGYFYILTDDPEVCRFNPTTDLEDVAYIATGFTNTIGANIFLTPYGLMFYSGDQIYSIDKAVPSTTSEFNDGMGADFLNGVTFTGSPLYRKNLKLAISTPSGIYYVKNTRHGGQPVAFVFRVDRDIAGNFVGNPIATLPTGSVALSITHHLSSIVIATSPDWSSILDNDTNEAEVVFYHITQDSLGALGSILGNRSALDETPFALLGTNGSQLFIGGHKRLWVYDAIRGGLHTAFNWDTELATGPYVAMADVQDSAGDSAMIFLGSDRIARIKTSKVVNPDTVTNFGDDETNYTLESNYFDANLPMEIKEVTKVAVMVDAGTTSQEWTVQLSTDDSSFVDVLTHSAAAQYGEAALSGTRGRLFRYKLIYQTKTAVRRALRALLFTFSTGQMIREWEVLLDGSEFLNVDNTILREDDFAAAMRLLAVKEEIVAASINYLGQEHNVDTATTTNVKIQAVEISKDKPGESVIKLIFREA